MGAPEPSAGRMPDMVAAAWAPGDGDHVLGRSQEFATAAPQLQRINDDWEQQLRMMFDKVAESDGEGGGEEDRSLRRD